MKKTDIKKLIDEGFNRAMVFDNIDWEHYIDRMFRAELKRERDYRNMRPMEHHGHRNSAALSARYFVVLWFKHALISTEMRPSDVLHCNPSSLMAKGLVDRWPEKAAKTFDAYDFDQFNKLGYEMCGIVDASEVAA